jgi:hypothetical protein
MPQCPDNKPASQPLQQQGRKKTGSDSDDRGHHHDCDSDIAQRAPAMSVCRL